MRTGLHWRGDQVFKRKESEMNATTVAVDLAKSVFQLAVADEHWRVIDTQRLTRTQFERWFANRDVTLVIMESCGSAHHWARWLNGLGIEVKLLPAQYIRAYVKRNKTDAVDAAALRGFCREFGIAIPVGARTGIEAISRVLADPRSAVPDMIRGTARLLIEEIRLLEARIAQ